MAITLVVAAVASAEPIRVSEEANDIITSSDSEVEDNIISKDQGVETVGHLTKRSPICKRSASPCIIKKSKKTLKKLKKLKKFKKFVVKPVKKFKKFVVKPKKLKKAIKKLPKLKKALPAGVIAKKEGEQVLVTADAQGADHARLQGLGRALIASWVKGAAEGCPLFFFASLCQNH